jgi:hypothetical protein
MSLHRHKIGNKGAGMVLRQLVQTQRDQGILLKGHGELLKKIVENQENRFGKMPLFGIDVSFLYQTL